MKNTSHGKSGWEHSLREIKYKKGGLEALLSQPTKLMRYCMCSKTTQPFLELPLGFVLGSNREGVVMSIGLASL